MSMDYRACKKDGRGAGGWWGVHVAGEGSTVCVERQIPSTGRALGDSRPSGTPVPTPPPTPLPGHLRRRGDVVATVFSPRRRGGDSLFSHFFTLHFQGATTALTEPKATKDMTACFGLFYGGLAQLIAGVMDMRRGEKGIEK